MKIELTMTELLLVVDLIKNGLGTEENTSDEDFTINFVTEEEPEEIVLKRKKKKK